ncbi:macro domain-containing protein [Halostagnicola sp. A-GB9-2]|uniref:macro domain-containing protein n=1 Tax=Halostagnicola sp. A-GB9-2 TaxID=3048066 RepID=UPI0024BFBC0B|nr:macro domain-containing protein [Halostagnicola sp. A-GB9-2]MDJ1433418.1 macro domain-containing protein [Halostagnicola sp. A-GB9-2]
MEYDIVQGDIATQSADALVNAAGTSLEMGSGVAGALRQAGGEGLNQEATENGPVDLGEVAVTDAYDLDADYVIHAAAMPHYGVHETSAESREPTRTSGSGDDGQATEQSIGDATRNALETADDLACQSLVIPALGCGVAGFDLEDGARIIAEELAEYDPETLEDVRFVAYSDEEYDAIRTVVDDVPETGSHAESETDR